MNDERVDETVSEQGKRPSSVAVFIWRHRQRGVFVVVAHDEDEARALAASQGITWLQHRAVDAVLKPRRGEFWNFRQHG
ncbi:MAG: hypothetical protein KatS3mg051_1424 [Anaerolineae bacterium]|nr:MAG: hypothetical protein KatS3mg051_1424 [Anaerolineae bacterium]